MDGASETLIFNVLKIILLWTVVQPVQKNIFFIKVGR